MLNKDYDHKGSVAEGEKKTPKNNSQPLVMSLKRLGAKRN
jgi:hypothetical protein